MDFSSLNKRIDDLEHDFRKEVADIDTSMETSFGKVKSKFNETNNKLSSLSNDLELLKSSNAYLSKKLVLCMFGFGFSSALSIITLALYLVSL